MYRTQGVLGKGNASVWTETRGYGAESHRRGLSSGDTQDWSVEDPRCCIKEQ